MERRPYTGFSYGNGEGYPNLVFVTPTGAITMASIAEWGCYRIDAMRWRLQRIPVISLVTKFTSPTSVGVVDAHFMIREKGIHKMRIEHSLTVRRGSIPPHAIIGARGSFDVF